MSTPPAMDKPVATPEALLSSVFGFSGFRPGQAEIVEAVASGQDVLAIMPTGGGKSLCFQLPALLREGVTVVISPLIALMRDQVRALREAGVVAGALTSATDAEESEAIFEGIDAGQLKLLYMAPERLARAGTAALLARIKPTLIAVDEAHCVSQWGHDFRPDYLEIGKLRARLGCQLAAFTATADPETREEIAARLFPKPPAVFLHGFDRPNLNLAFLPKQKPREQVLDYVAARRGLSGIVYCSSRARTETLANALSDAGHAALAYHAGMDADDRRWAETRFQREDGLVVCATVAFGMGIDKPDIRYVMHADLPKSIESYYQEIGRAGRDGAPAETLTLFGADDVRLRRAQIDEGLAPPERKAADHGRLNTLLGLAETPWCRRKALLGYFGETPEGDCGNCDNCRDKPETFDGTEAAQMAFSAVLRTGQSFGMMHLIDILRGTASDKVKTRGHDSLPTFGVGKRWSKAEWQVIFRQLLGLDLLRPDAARHGALVMTEAARPLLRGEASVTLRMDRLKAAGGAGAPQAKSLVPEEDAPLFALLKGKRRALAEAQKVPAYVIFPDRTLMEMAARRPETLDQMRGISGIGDKKLERYGAEFLEVITGEATAEVHPARRKIAGRSEAGLFDALEGEMVRLARGESGLDVYLSCTRATLAKIAALRPDTLEALDAVQGMGPRKTERFGAAFLEVLHAEAES
ncbi:DNA helicase RecQ [Oceanibium sediminis]|uniref:DNA helicase RecQ n=1 Tax=Oceanibium sediminis TaxID=2026339 RepID=UPI001E42FE73|nr:DNA helicase RecQ [Oceanibium sediminis]